MQLDINQLNANPDLQTREIVYDTSVVAEYAESMRDGATFPPVTVFFDGAVYWLADGFHRWAAAQQAGLDTLDADVRNGSKRDAILFAVGANADNGLRRTSGDKRKAVEKLLNDREWSNLPLNQIAKLCKVSWDTVNRIHNVLSSRIEKIERPVERIATRNGSTYTMNTANIGATERVLKPLIRDNPTPNEVVDGQLRYSGYMALKEKGIDVLDTNEPEPDEPEALDCGTCRFYKSDIRSDKFYCLALERIYSMDGLAMPCNGNNYLEYRDGFCECCGQALP